MVSSVVMLFGVLLVSAVLVYGAQSHLRLRRRLREMERRAIEVGRMLRERGALANELAHEIKNPLAAIVCSAEALDHLIGGEIDENNRKCLGYIRQYGHNLLHLISDYLDLSRVEAGFLKSDPVEVPIGLTIQSIGALLQSHCVKARVSLAMTIEDEELIVIADPAHVKKVIFSVLRYAISVTPPRAEVRLRVGYQAASERVIIGISDQRAPLSAEELHRLFSPQVQLLQAIQDEDDNPIGLSLALSRSLVEQAGGTFTARSEPAGNYFEITLPARQPAPLATPEMEAVDRPLSGRRYLLVDCHAGPRESVARLLESLGGMVDQVTEASDAVRRIATSAYDAVMLNQSSEGFGAPKLTELCRSSVNGRGSKIIAAAQSPDDRRLARDAGADICVETPLDSRKLLQSLRQR